MDRYRYRLIFGKRGDLRWIGHNDLVRVFERCLRRANLRLGMSQGFHPKPRMSFPSALALGIEGLAEVMEFELNESLPAEHLADRLRAEFPAGLELVSVTALPCFTMKAALDRVVYKMAIPATRQDAVRAALAVWQQGAPCSVPKRHSERLVDPRAGLARLELCEEHLILEQRIPDATGVGPREVLAALGIADLETLGHVLVRARVDLAPDPAPRPPARPPADAIEVAP